MAIRMLCVNEVTTVAQTHSETITCTNPSYTPVGVGDECNVVVYNVSVNLGDVPPTLSFSFDAQYEYEYEHQGGTFQDFCTVTGSSGSLTLPNGTSTCCTSGTLPSVTYSASCGSITSGPTFVSGNATISFTVTNLCAQTIICVEDTECVP